MYFSSVQFSPVAQSCPTLCDPMNRSTPGLPVHHQLLEFTQTHVHRVGDAIQPSHPSPPAPIPPSIRVFSNESALLMRWPKWMYLIPLNMLNANFCYVYFTVTNLSKDNKGGTVFFDRLIQVAHINQSLKKYWFLFQLKDFF